MRGIHFPKNTSLICARLALVFCLSIPLAARAVLLFGSGDPTANTTPPTGDLADSGWEFEGRWGYFTGTAIAPQFFITARHVGGEVGLFFSYQGVDYATTAFYDDPRSDLRLWRIDGRLPAYAPLYDGVDEVGKKFVVIGRGTQRGAEIWSDPSTPKVVRAQPRRGITPAGAIVLCGKDRDGLPPRKRPAILLPPPAGSTLKGWENGPADGVQRWGENQFGGVLNFRGSLGEILTATFDADAGPNEATLSVGDSGGAAFIQVDGVWKLAGINYGVSGPYRRNPSAPVIYGAIFNEGGLYKGTRLVPDRAQPSPGSLYITRVSARVDWIRSIINPF
ncbi:MAG: hypothetical protein HY043_22665 [Verrucomicrobia bacterium]|nr:hypothetical protein [Verrucomicrobiota bacterium]